VRLLRALIVVCAAVVLSAGSCGADRAVKHLVNSDIRNCDLRGPNGISASDADRDPKAALASGEACARAYFRDWTEGKTDDAKELVSFALARLGPTLYDVQFRSTSPDKFLDQFSNEGGWDGGTCKIPTADLQEVDCTWLADPATHMLRGVIVTVKRNQAVDAGWRVPSVGIDYEDTQTPAPSPSATPSPAVCVADAPSLLGAVTSLVSDPSSVKNIKTYTASDGSLWAYFQAVIANGIQGNSQFIVHCSNGSWTQAGGGVQSEPVPVGTFACGVPGPPADVVTGLGLTCE
jgi:hypothetical protein